MRAFKKYGIHNFTRQILCKIKINDILLVNKLEKFFITKYNSTDNKIGYNIIEGAPTEYNAMFKEEVRERVSVTMKEQYKIRKNPMYGKKHSKESKLKMRKRALGRVSPLRGKKLSDETKHKISVSVKSKIGEPGFKEKLRNSHKGILLGKKSPIFGKILINNGIIQKYHTSDESIPLGWIKGGLPRNKVLK